MKFKDYIKENTMTDSMKRGNPWPTKMIGTVNTETGEWKEGFSDNLYDTQKGMYVSVWQNLKTGKDHIRVGPKRDAGKVGDVQSFKKYKSQGNMPWFDAKLVKQMPISKLKKSGYKNIAVWK